MKAYLVAVLDSTCDPPQVVGAGLYSAPWGELTLPHKHGRCYADLASASGETYVEAMSNLKAFIASYPGLAWAKKWID